MADAVIAGGMAERVGYTKLVPSCIELVASPLGQIRLALGWMQPDELLADLAATMERQSAPAVKARIDALVRHLESLQVK